MAVFDAREVSAAAEQDGDYPAFTFIALDGEEYELPNPMWLETGVVRRMNEAMIGGNDEALAQILALVSPSAAEAIDKLPVLVTAQLIQEWQTVVPEEGKLVSPPSPRNRAERRSEPTSPSETSTSGRSRSGKPRAA